MSDEFKVVIQAFICVFAPMLILVGGAFYFSAQDRNATELEWEKRVESGKCKIIAFSIKETRGNDAGLYKCGEQYILGPTPTMRN